MTLYDRRLAEEDRQGDSVELLYTSHIKRILCQDQYSGRVDGEVCGSYGVRFHFEVELEGVCLGFDKGEINRIYILKYFVEY